MGKQKQQRRSAKKKQKGGTKNEAQDETVPTLKCTACRQVVAVDTSIACPVPECNRIFCTQRCSAKCIIRCSNPKCDCEANLRCRPCATGKTYEMLERRYDSEETGKKPSDLASSFYRCGTNGCETLTFGGCRYFLSCTKCRQHACRACYDRSGLILFKCKNCKRRVCAECDKTFDRDASECTMCTLACAIEESSFEDSDEGEGKGPLTPFVDPDQSKTVDEIVLRYAPLLQTVMLDIAMVAGFSSWNCPPLAASTSEVLGQIMESSSASDKSYVERMALKVSLYFRHNNALEDVEEGASNSGADPVSSGEDSVSLQKLSLYRAFVNAMSSEMETSFKAFGMMRQLLSNKYQTCIDRYELDVFHKLYENQVCGHCLLMAAEDGPYKRCGGCKSIYYCNETCQAKNWLIHRKRCAFMKSAREVFNSRSMVNQGPLMECEEPKDVEELGAEDNSEKDGNYIGNGGGISIGGGERG